MTKSEIDDRINKTLSVLSYNQEADGSFKTFCAMPNVYGRFEWKEDKTNTFLTANILLPLTLIQTKAARKILNNAHAALEKNRNVFGLWHYFHDKKAPYFIPFETDTNSLMSYISVKFQKKPVSDYLIRQQLSESGYINLWFLPQKKVLLSNPLYFLSLWLNRRKAQKYLAFKNKVVEKSDAEFCVTANALLYLGDNAETQPAVARLLNDMQSDHPIRLIYYPRHIIAYYLFARAYFYGNIRGFETVKEKLEEKIVNAHAHGFSEVWEPLNILAASAFLFFNISSPFALNTIEKGWSLFDRIQHIFPFYCSNSIIDFNSETNLHNAYFGSPELTVSFYLEFLNLLRLRKYGELYSG